ncbi:MarR family winged helix-turn-helix transcriptional regulator [Actinosynnema sp. NPDC020468]|uniref:MarR family winged helix-turn-helix transcriptional regulator n=1 Tax=Actinosynnema sp. NPDC020468 TaxID=3154488 RepID=UPI0033E69BD0
MADQTGSVSHAIAGLARQYRALATRLLREAGLHPGQELVMMHLWDHGPRRQTCLCAELGADSATMTRTVQRLEKAGFVRRAPDPCDGRATLVEPTTASHALRLSVERSCAELEEAATAGMKAAERADCLRVLGRLEANLATRGGKPDRD